MFFWSRRSLHNQKDHTREMVEEQQERGKFLLEMCQAGYPLEQFEKPIQTLERLQNNSFRTAEEERKYEQYTFVLDRLFGRHLQEILETRKAMTQSQKETKRS